MIKQVEIFVVEVSFGSANIASVKAIEKDKTYQTDRSTQVTHLGWLYIGKTVRKGDNVFMNAKDAATYAAAQLAKYIDKRQEEINEARNNLQELYKMLGISRQEPQR